MRALHIVGRTIFGGFFVYSGITHFQQRNMMAQYAASKGVPAPSLAVKGSGALAIAGGLSVLAGASPRRGLTAILAFLIPVSLQMHRFWELDDPQQRTAERVNFTKNVALIGAALTMMQIREPWPASVDSARREEEMYVRLGGRDLRSLPA